MSDSDIVAVKERLVLQPMSIAMNADDLDFQAYSSGVYEGVNCDTNVLNHAMVLVGFTDSGDTVNQSTDTPTGDGSNEGSNEPVNLVNKWYYYDDASQGRRLQDTNGFDQYWKIQNSWGSGWGDEGFILFKMQDGPGVCGMNKFIEYIDMSDEWYASQV